MSRSYSMPLKFENKYLAALLSVMVGFLILKFSYMGLRWMVCGVSVLLLLAGSVVISDMRKFFLSLFFLSLPISAMNFLGTLDDFHYGGAPGVYHTIYDFFLILLYALWIPRLLIRRDQKIFFSGMDICFWLIVLMSLLSIHNAVAIHFSTYEIIRLGVMYLIFLFAENLTRKDDIKLATFVLLFGLLAETILGFIQYKTGGFLGLNLLGERSTPTMVGELSRVGGTLGHPNAFARYLGFLIPLTFSLQLAPLKMKYKVACVVLFLLSTAVLVMTFSRASWGGLAFSLVLIVVLGVIAGLVSWRRAFVFSVIGLLSLSALAFVFKDAIAARLFSYDHGSISSRIPQIEIATNIIQSHPVIGVGINNYAEVMQHFDDTGERITSWFPNVVHNVYLLIASEIGIPGLLFFLTFVFLLYKTGFEVMRSADRFMKAVVIGLMAGITSFLIQILVMPPTFTSSSFLFFWVFAGLIAGMNNQQRHQIGELRYE